MGLIIIVVITAALSSFIVGYVVGSSRSSPTSSACTVASGCLAEREGERTAPCAYSCARDDDAIAQKSSRDARMRGPL